MSAVLRDINDRCNNCKFWRATERNLAGEEWAGECRRYAPTAGKSAEWSFWPKVAAKDWCGEWSDNQEWQ